MEQVYLEIVNFLIEGPWVRVFSILIFFSFFALVIGVGLLWYRNPEFFKSTVENLLSKNLTDEVEGETQTENLPESLDLIRTLSANSIDFEFSGKGAVLHFPEYLRARPEDRLSDLFRSIVSSIRENPGETRVIEFDLKETKGLNQYSINSVCEVVEDVQTNNGVYLIVTIRGRALSSLDATIRRILARSDSKSATLRRRK